MRRPARRSPSARTRPEEDRHTWRNISTLGALGGVLIALIFNTIGVWQQVEQAELGVRQANETRRAAELEVLTQLNEAAAASDRAINATAAWDNRCGRITVQTLSAADEARIIAALDQYDYLAFLVSRRHVTLEEAAHYWERDMVEAYTLAKAFIDPGWLATHHLHLKRFYERAPASLRPPCP